MLNNKKFRIFLSIVIAIALWVYVVGTMDPSNEKTYASIPIEVVGEEKLDEIGLAISNVNLNTIDIEVEARNSIISNLDDKDFTAVIDVSQAHKGVNEVKIKVKAPDGVSLKNQSSATCKVTVETQIKDAKKIELSIPEDLSDDQEIELVSKELDSVYVTGSVSKMEEIDHIAAIIDMDNLQEGENKLVAILKPVDRNSYELDRLVLDNTKISLNVNLYQVKQVKLDFESIGQGKGRDGLIRSVTVPKSILVMGLSKDLEGIDSVKAESLTISDIKSDKDIELKLDLPEGVKLSKKQEKVVAKVIVK
ncbi:MAG: CdaR family protein [Clostridia bacterium]|nr:CdaR family protein [Clostridia bacterium]